MASTGLGLKGLGLRDWGFGSRCSEVERYRHKVLRFGALQDNREETAVHPNTIFRARLVLETGRGLAFKVGGEGNLSIWKTGTPRSVT